MDPKPRVLLIGDPPAADHVKAKLEPVCDLLYVRNRPGTIRVIPANVRLVIAMNAREAGTTIKALAKRVNADFISVPPSWTGVMEALGKSGWMELVKEAVGAGAKTNGADAAAPVPAVQYEPTPLPPAKAEAPEPPAPARPPAAAPEVKPPKTVGGIHARFAERRKELHEARGAETEKAIKLLTEFIRLRRGDVSAQEAAALMRASGMPFPSKEYVMARDAAGVPLRKTCVKHKPRNRKDELSAQWRELIATTPDDQLPRLVTTLDPAPPKAAPPAPGAAPDFEARAAERVAKAFDLGPAQEIPTDALMAELRRRKAALMAELDALKSIP